MRDSQLKTVTKTAPRSSGIYLFMDSKNKPLYIGKAFNLRNRIKSYAKTKDARIQKMLSMAKKIDFIRTGSEIEALILESQYIKKHKPAFNIMMRDDKQFGFVGFTNDKFSKIFITHQPVKITKHKTQSPKTQTAKFVGPFTDIGALKTTLRYLRRIFPYCTCRQTHHNFCLNYHIGKCPGFCCLKQQKPNPQLITASAESRKGGTTYNLQPYRKNIKDIKDILSGKKTLLLKKLEKEMVTLGKKQEFDKAIELRGKIEKIKRVFENARIIQNIPYYDISNNHNEGTLLELKKILRIKQPSRHIEGYDVANIQGKYAVGAMVVFTLQQSSGQANYKPDKNEYRKFKIYSKQSSDDTAMLKEVLTRRFNHPEWPLPDLIIVDGGKAQLSAALKVISNFKFLISKQIPVIALTKDEKHRGSKIFIAGKKTAIPLSRLPTSVKNLLIQINSEAHRFAIGYYRNLHRKKFKIKTPTSGA